MPPHVVTLDASISPDSRNKHHTRDPTRQPDVPKQPSAPLDRIHMLMDSENCTIRMALDDFKARYVPDAEGFDSFFPQRTIKKISRDFRRICKSKDERKITQKWLELDTMRDGKDIDNNYRGLCPGFLFNSSEDKPEPGDVTASKVDGSFIPIEDQEYIQRGVPNWALQRFSVEFKNGGTSHDPFDDHPAHNPEAEAVSRRSVRGQLFAYAERVFAYQQRNALFMLFVNGSEFRVLRWDRSGIIVTEATDYTQSHLHTKVLLEVLYGFSRMSIGQAGLDSTTVRLTKNSCGWRRMEFLTFDHRFDVDERERIINDPHKTVIPADFLLPAKTAPHSPLFDRHFLQADPCKGDCNHAAAHNGHVIPVFKNARQLYRKSVLSGWPRYRVKICGQDYLVAKPNFQAAGPVSRGTGGYVALEWDTQRIVYLKDAWRPNFVGLSREGDVLEELNAKGVVYVPTLICHEDVAGQETETSRFAPPTVSKEARSDTSSQTTRQVRPSPCRPPSTGAAAKRTAPARDPAGPSSLPTVTQATQAPSTGKRRRDEDDTSDNGKRFEEGSGLRHLIHYRIVVAEVCMPSTAYTFGKQLARIVLQCIYAHEQAATLCKWIHRDVSAGNILIYPAIVHKNGKTFITWTGLLSDWELAKHILADGAEDQAFQPQRTGTWQFMSIPCLLNRDKPFEIADELESFVHVLIYDAIRFMHHNFNRVFVHGFMQKYFDGYNETPDGDSCGDIKLQSIAQAKLIYMNTELKFRLEHNNASAPHPLNALLSELLEVFQARYIVWEWNNRAEPAQPSLPFIDSSSQDDNDPSMGVIPRDMELRKGKTQTQTTQGKTGPTPEQFALADRLKTHAYIRTMFWDHLSAKWPGEIDTHKDDDLLQGYRPNETRSTTWAQARKKARTAIDIPHTIPEERNELVLNEIPQTS